MNLNSFFKNNHDLNFPAIISDDYILNYNTIDQIENINDFSFIIYSKNVSFVFYNLLKLDGFAKIISLIPTSIDPIDLETILTSNKFDFIISDEKLEIDKDHKLRILKNVKELYSNNLIELSHNNKKIETQWLIPTSGTTGKPKLVIHTLESLINSVKRFKKNEKIRKWGLLYDHCRFAGIQVILQSLFNGDTLIAPKISWSLIEKLNFLSIHNCTHLSATPTLWRKILLSEYSNKFNFNQITLGGEAADQVILSNLKKKYPYSKITHIYASTEFGVVLSISDYKEGFPKYFLDKAHNGIQLKIINHVLFLKNELMIGKYFEGENFANDDKWINSGDIVKIKDDRVFIIGRENGLIIVGGDKVLPNEIKKILLKCNIVSDAVVYGKSSPITGQLVAANIVLINKNIENEKAKLIITDFSHKYLKRFEVPRFINIVKDIKINTSGKGI